MMMGGRGPLAASAGTANEPQIKSESRISFFIRTELMPLTAFPSSDLKKKTKKFQIA
jgi:hypothetical protein